MVPDTETEFWSHTRSHYSQLIISLTQGTRIQSKDELLMHNVMESCVFKSVMSFVVGGALGGKFIYNFFLSAMSFRRTSKD